MPRKKTRVGGVFIAIKLQFIAIKLFSLYRAGKKKNIVHAGSKQLTCFVEDEIR